MLLYTTLYVVVNLFSVNDTSQGASQQTDDKAFYNNFSCGDPLVETVERVARISLIVSQII